MQVRRRRTRARARAFDISAARSSAKRAPYVLSRARALPRPSLASRRDRTPWRAALTETRPHRGRRRRLPWSRKKALPSTRPSFAPRRAVDADADVYAVEVPVPKSVALAASRLEPSRRRQGVARPDMVRRPDAGSTEGNPYSAYFYTTPNLEACMGSMYSIFGSCCCTRRVLDMPFVYYDDDELTPPLISAACAAGVLGRAALSGAPTQSLTGAQQLGRGWILTRTPRRVGVGCTGNYATTSRPWTCAAPACPRCGRARTPARPIRGATIAIGTPSTPAGAASNATTSPRKRCAAQWRRCGRPRGRLTPAPSRPRRRRPADDAAQRRADNARASLAAQRLRRRPRRRRPCQRRADGAKRPRRQPRPCQRPCRRGATPTPPPIIFIIVVARPRHRLCGIQASARGGRRSAAAAPGRPPRLERGARVGARRVGAHRRHRAYHAQRQRRERVRTRVTADRAGRAAASGCARKTVARRPPHAICPSPSKNRR